MDAKEWLYCHMSCFSKAGDNESLVGDDTPTDEWKVGFPGAYPHYAQTPRPVAHLNFPLSSPIVPPLVPHFPPISLRPP